jgi:hypothetical protein
MWRYVSTTTGITFRVVQLGVKTVSEGTEIPKKKHKSIPAF